MDSAAFAFKEDVSMNSLMASASLKKLIKKLTINGTSAVCSRVWIHFL